MTARWAKTTFQAYLLPLRHSKHSHLSCHLYHVVQKPAGRTNALLKSPLLDAWEKRRYVWGTLYTHTEKKKSVRKSWPYLKSPNMKAAIMLSINTREKTSLCSTTSHSFPHWKMIKRCQSTESIYSTSLRNTQFTHQNVWICILTLKDSDLKYCLIS